MDNRNPIQKSGTVRAKYDNAAISFLRKWQTSSVYGIRSWKIATAIAMGLGTLGYCLRTSRVDFPNIDMSKTAQDLSTSRSIAEISNTFPSNLAVGVGIGLVFCGGLWMCSGADDAWLNDCSFCKGCFARHGLTEDFFNALVKCGPGNGKNVKPVDPVDPPSCEKCQNAKRSGGAIHLLPDQPLSVTAMDSEDFDFLNDVNVIEGSESSYDVEIVSNSHTSEYSDDASLNSSESEPFDDESEISHSK